MYTAHLLTHTVMTSFSLSRLARLLRYEIGVSFRKDMITYASLMLGIIMMRTMMFFQTETGEESAWRVTMLFQGMIIFYVITLVIYASQLQYGANEKKIRQHELMLPASGMEKYLVRMIHIVVIPCLVLFVGLFISDLAHYPIAAALGNVQTGFVWHSFLPYVFEVLLSTKVGLVALASLIQLHALFLLGGALFKKSPFWLSVFLQQAINMLFSLPFYVYLYFNGNKMALVEYVLPRGGNLLIGFSLLAAVLLHVAAYRLFVRREIEGRTWLNV